MRRREFWIQICIAIFCLLLVIFCSSRPALSFPQNSRLGYGSCNTCHYSPSGGGALRPYGKSTAAELSTWQTGIDPADTRIITGGDLRYVSIQTETETETVENKFLMQAALELGYEGDYFDYVIEVGQYFGVPYPVYGSYKHYIQTRILGLGIRFGKFSPAFGINHEDHTLPGRNKIGFRDIDAGVNTELSHAGKHWNFNATAIHGCQGILSDVMQKGYCDQDKDRLGVVGHLGWTPATPVFLSISGAHTENRLGETQNAYALGWVIGRKAFYTMGEYVRNDQATEVSSQYWIDFIGSWKGLDLGMTYRGYGEEDVPGLKVRWLPIDHAEFSMVYLIKEDLNQLLAVGHLYF